MKEQKTTEIATNVSSGAEKVEIVEKKVETDAPSVHVESKDGKKTVSTRTKKQPVSKATKTEEKAAKERIDKALKKEKEKANKKERFAKLKAEMQARAEKRAAAKKARAEKRAAEKKASIEKRKAEREAQIRERAHRKATRAQEKSKAKREKSKTPTQRKPREHKKGYGGWLAAVISLGAVTLALSTALTVGAIDMKAKNETMATGYKSTAYELMGIMENVENDLDRARISASPAQQSRILTDLLVQARLAELDLEKMPVRAEEERNLTTLINRVASECERMLAKLRKGEDLNARDREILQSLYEKNRAAREEVGDFAQMMTDTTFFDFMKKGKGMLKDVIDKVENATLDENKIGENDGAGMRRNADAPNVNDETVQKIEPSKAEELCAQYFSAYNVMQFQCIGETVAKGFCAYNVQGYDSNGTLLFAEVDCKDGKLIRFDYYEDCNSETFDRENAQRIAEEFLSGLGYEDMQAVRLRDNGTDADFTFVYVKDGVAYYPDSVHVKVCRTRGVVAGFDGVKYARNHRQREEVETKISLPQAQAKLHDGLEVNGARLVVVETGKTERPAYEFVCTYGEEQYVIYTDAQSGEELAIVNLKSLG